MVDEMDLKELFTQAKAESLPRPEARERVILDMQTTIADNYITPCSTPDMPLHRTGWLPIAVVVLIFALASTALVYRQFQNARSQAPDARHVCDSNVKQISLALLMYAGDWDQQLPLAKNWSSAILPYFKDRKLLHCPADASNAVSSYGMNKVLAGKNIGRIKNQAQVVMLYETKHPGTAPVGDAKDVASPPRHDGGNNYGYVDGHAMWTRTVPNFTPVFTKPPKSRRARR